MTLKPANVFFNIVLIIAAQHLQTLQMQMCICFLDSLLNEMIRTY